ncbi:hypothetical protein BJ742DRAFT_765782 [Cladochytrium replicatum]|nr:hypothetical protein BJ742DRAFT_765782 [Cladochytrium replicatum]
MPALILSSMKNHGFKLLFRKRRSNKQRVFESDNSSIPYNSSQSLPGRSNNTYDPTSFRPNWPAWPPPPTGYAEPEEFLLTGVSSRMDVTTTEQGERILVLPGGHRMVQPKVANPGGAVHSIPEATGTSVSVDAVDASIAVLLSAASGFPDRRLAHLSGSTFDIDTNGSEMHSGYHESPVSSTAAQPPMTPQQQISSITHMHNLGGEQLGGLHPPPARPRPSPSGASIVLASPMRRQLEENFPKPPLPIALDIVGMQPNPDPLNTRVKPSLPREDFGVSSGNLSDTGPHPGTSTETVRPTALQRSGTFGSVRNSFFDEPTEHKRPNTSLGIADANRARDLKIVFPADLEPRMQDSPAQVPFDGFHNFPANLPEYLVATGAADVEMRRNASVRSMATTASVLSTPAGVFRGSKYLTKRSPRSNVRESMSSKRSSVATPKSPRSRGNSNRGSVPPGSVVSAAAAAALLAYADASGESNRNSLAEYATEAVNDFTIARVWLQQNPSLSGSLPRSRRSTKSTARWSSSRASYASGITDSSRAPFISDSGASESARQAKAVAVVAAVAADAFTQDPGVDFSADAFLDWYIEGLRLYSSAIDLPMPNQEAATAAAIAAATAVINATEEDDRKRAPRKRGQARMIRVFKQQLDTATHVKAQLGDQDVQLSRGPSVVSTTLSGTVTTTTPGTKTDTAFSAELETTSTQLATLATSENPALNQWESDNDDVWTSDSGSINRFQGDDLQSDGETDGDTIRQKQRDRRRDTNSTTASSVVFTTKGRWSLYGESELIEARLQRRLTNGSLTTISVNEELWVEPRRKKVNSPKRWGKKGKRPFTAEEEDLVLSDISVIRKAAMVAAGYLDVPNPLSPHYSLTGVSSVPTSAHNAKNSHTANSRFRTAERDDTPQFSPFNDKKDAEARSIWAPSDTEPESDVPTKSPEAAFANFAARQRSINMSGPSFVSNNQRVSRDDWEREERLQRKQQQQKQEMSYGDMMADDGPKWVEIPAVRLRTNSVRSGHRITRTTSGMRSRTDVYVQDERGRFWPVPFSDQGETHVFKTSNAAKDTTAAVSTPGWELHRASFGMNNRRPELRLSAFYSAEPQIEVISGGKEDARLEDDDWVDLDDTDSIISDSLPRNRAKSAMSHREPPAEVPGLPLFSPDQSTYPFKSLSPQNSASLSPLAVADQHVPELSTSPTSVPNSVPSLSGLSAGTHYKTDPIYAGIGSPSTSAGTYDGRLQSTPSTSFFNFGRPSFSESPQQKAVLQSSSVDGSFTFMPQSTEQSEDDQFSLASPINPEITASVLKRVAAASAVIRASEMAGSEKESLTTAARELLNISKALKDSQTPEVGSQSDRYVVGGSVQSQPQFPPSQLSMQLDSIQQAYSNSYSSSGVLDGAGLSGTSYDRFNNSAMGSPVPMSSHFQQPMGVPTSAELYGLNLMAMDAMMGFGLIGNSGGNRIARAATTPPSGLVEEERGGSKSEGQQLISDDPALQNLPPGTSMEQIFYAVEKFGASASTGYNARPSTSTTIPAQYVDQRLDMSPGDVVIMIQHASDEWAYGLNWARGCMGYFPMAMVIPYSAMH